MIDKFYACKATMSKGGFLQQQNGFKEIRSTTEKEDGKR